MYTPRNLLDLVSEIFGLSMFMLILSLKNFLRVNIIHCVFFRFRDTLLTLCHINNSASYLDKNSLIEGRSIPLAKIFHVYGTLIKIYPEGPK